MASRSHAKNSQALSRKHRTSRRNLLVQMLERRELLAAEMGHPVWAPGTPDATIDEFFTRLTAHGVSAYTGNAVTDPVISGTRWRNPTGGASPNEGDPVRVTWSIVPDGTPTLDIEGATGAGSDLIAFLDGLYGGAGTPDVENKPWFRFVERAYDRWSEIAGISFEYESADDGAAMGGTSRGVIGVRGDMRVGGAPIDGDYNILAYNFYPSGGGDAGADGDMVVDTTDIFYTDMSDGPNGANLALVNVLAHEAGHGIGLDHAIPQDGTKLMEPVINMGFFGPQIDELVLANQLYGDRYEAQERIDGHIDLGLLANGTHAVFDLSIDKQANVDLFRVEVTGPRILGAMATPLGGEYMVGADGGTASLINTLRHSNLKLRVLAEDKTTVIAEQNVAGIGEAEMLAGVELPEAGTYFIEVSGVENLTQLYEFQVSLGMVTANPADTAPRLISVQPNADEILTPEQTNPLSVRPTELTFRFGGSQDIDPATLDAIRVTRAGGDGQFGNDNDIEIEPGYVGFDQTNRIVVFRFAEALEDDFYRVDVFAVDDPANGIVGLRDVGGDLLLPSDPSADRETRFFNLELGARVVGVVPQPVVGTGTSRTQLTRQVHVYFDDPDLFFGPQGAAASLTDPRFYKLIRTNNTAGTSDDQLTLPSSVTVTPDLQRVELHFDDDLHLLTGSGVFRLRVGTDEQVAPPLQTVTLGPEPGATVGTAANLGTMGGRAAMLVQGETIVGGSLPFDYPGGNNEPGGRQIQDESHVGDPDGSAAIPRISFTVRNGIPYGVNSAGQTVFSEINPTQQERVREIFDYYSELLGVDFYEVDGTNANFQVVVGDMAPHGRVSEPGGVAGVAGGGLAIMDGAEIWDDSAGGGFFGVALHEIGHLLGLGHTYDLPEGTVQGNMNYGGGTEYVFPGDHDVVHGRYLYRPDNRDVDMYRFTVPEGESGTISIETIAERMANSSTLDTSIILYRLLPSGDLEKVAGNDDFFGDDSYLNLSVSSGVYFISVFARGNETHSPTAANTGSGGFSQGGYDLRVEFHSDQADTIVDWAGSALDGDGNGLEGGAFNFWFRANDPTSTVYVDPGASVGGDGSLSRPFRSMPAALAAASALPETDSGAVVRMLPGAGADGDIATLGDNRAYEIGRNSLNAPLADGANLTVPAGVTVMVEPGAVLKLRGSRIAVGSGEGGIDNSLGAFQVLGTPELPVHFTSYNDSSIGINSNPLIPTPRPGDWGGIQIRNDIDRAQGRVELERHGIFLNYIAGADIRYGGGQVLINNQPRTIAPIDLSAARPTILHNSITQSTSAAITADPPSFEETTFNETRYQRFGAFVADYDRRGPQIYGNTIVENSINGMLVRVAVDSSGNLQELEVPARFANTEIVHVLGDNLTISGQPGGAVVDNVLPGLDAVVFTPQSGQGTLAAGTYRYRMSFVDAAGNETAASASSRAVVLAADGRITLTDLPVASGEFVGRRLYRSVNGGAFEYITDLNRSRQSFTDTGLATNPALNPLTGTIARPRIDARLAIDPGIIVKSNGIKIATGFGADLIAEGAEGRPVVMTARSDDRYGAGGTFNTNNSATFTTGSQGSWAGIYAAPFGNISIDHAVIAYAGGNAGAFGTSYGFNAVELHQAYGRIAHTTFEYNAAGLRPNDGARGGLAPHDQAVIYVAGAQPVIVENVFRNNSVAGTAMVSINANALTTTPLDDMGRQTGTADVVDHPPGNVGPLVRGNAITQAGIGGMRVRGGTLTTETVWDDTDIVHVLTDTILVPDLHTFGGLRLQSRHNESLVAKFGSGAALVADGRPLDIEDRIGGRVQILGAPGFPVVMTSLADDSVGAGFDPTGLPYRDTNGNGGSTGTAGDWRGIVLNEFSNDRNVATVTEFETRVAGGGDVNGGPGQAQYLGQLATELRSGDENLRLGFTVHGAIADPGDTDVYSFTGIAGTEVWLDIDRTGAALDSVIEIINANGQVLIRSDNSHQEQLAGALSYVNASAIAAGHALPMRKSAFAPTNGNGTYRDLYTTNPLDAGMRFVLPGSAGATDEYFIRVTGADGTTGLYQMQLRLQEQDEFGGSAVQYANIRYAQVGIDTKGLPAHSLLTGEAAVNPNAPTVPVNLGNILTSERAAASASGWLAGETVGTGQNTFAFRVERAGVQNIDGGTPELYSTVTIDVDYADGFGRPDTTALLYRVTGGTRQLVAVGTNSNISGDRARPLEGSDLDGLLRGSAGSRDAFIGTMDLLAGDYELVITNNALVDAQVSAQYSTANPANPLVRLEPLDSVQRIAEDRNFNNSTTPAAPTTTVSSARQVAFSGLNNATPYALGDVPAFIAGTVNGQNNSRIYMPNAQTGRLEAVLGTGDATRLGALAMDPRGRLVGIQDSILNTNDGNTQTFVLLDDATSNGAFSNLGSTGLQTYNAEFNADGDPVVVRSGVNGVGVGVRFRALDFRIHGSDQGQNRLYGVGDRGTFRRGILDADGNVVGVGDAVTARNVLYRLNPDTGVVINANNNNQPRTGNASAYGAGTNGVEVGFLEFPESAGQSLQGTVSGITFIGNTMYAVTNAGELFMVDFIPDNNLNPNETNYLLNSPSANRLVTLNDPDTGAPISFSDLAIGPQNADGGIHANVLYAIADNGKMYAIGTAGAQYGELLPMFAGGARTISTGVTDATGLDFTNVDINLWSVTSARQGDAGHGTVPTPTNTRDETVEGGNSLYFGYTPNDNSVSRAASFNGGHDPSPRSAGSYNIAGGAKGAIDSYAIDLSEYSLEDEPMLYFNYFLDSEDASALINSGDHMRDSLRVYAAGDDNVWRLVATNNLAGLDNDFGNGPNENSADEFDTIESGYVDENGQYRFVQPLFNTGQWRQARVSLAPFAGSSNVRIRMEFNSAGEPDRDVIELRGLPGDQLLDQFNNSFTVGNSAGAVEDFQFDHGVVLDLPSGAALTDGDTFTVEGETFTFVSGAPSTPNEIAFTPNLTPQQVADRVAFALQSVLSMTVSRSSTYPSLVNLAEATEFATTSGNLQTMGLIVDQPGTFAGVSVPINIGMDATEVRDAIRAALARGLNEAGSEDAVHVYPLSSTSSDGVRIFGGTLFDPGPLPYIGSQDGDWGMPGERSGLYVDASEQNYSGNTLDRQRLAGERARNNAGEGVFIDDIVIGFAERGEMVTGHTGGGLAQNPFFEPIILGDEPNEESAVGAYQVEIRTSAEYALSDISSPGDRNINYTDYDTNEVLGEQVGMRIIGGGAAIRDGDSFTISDGFETIRFEFDNLEIPAGSPHSGVSSGSVALPYRSSMTPAQIATLIRDAINSTTVQNRIDVHAASPSGEVTGTQSSQQLILHGQAAATQFGGMNFGLPSIIQPIYWGAGLSGRGGDSLTGDRNRVRDQGQIIIANSVIADSSGFGIDIDAGRRNRSAEPHIHDTASTALPRPGSPISFPTQQNTRLAPGVVVMNNILVGNGQGGIRVAGDPQTGNAVEVPVPFARLVNNTIVGNGSGGIGILVESQASPSLINNVIVDHAVGVQVSNNGNQAVELIGNLFAGNATNAVGTPSGTGAEAITVTPGQPLFLNQGDRNFIPAAGSLLIDTSIDFTAERLGLGVLREALGIRRSPILAPTRDLTGQLRVDGAGPGIGSSFVDRGALDRSDSFGPQARLFTPLDNDVTGTDLDLADTFVRLSGGTLSFFELQLTDAFGTGIDGSTVTADTVFVTENGRMLSPGSDYTFGFDATTNVMRLTPLAGIWRPDAVYEITLNNRLRQVAYLPSGGGITDGDQIVVTDIAGTSATFEFDTGFVVAIPAAGVVEGDRLIYETDEEIRRIEWLEVDSEAEPQSDTDLVVRFVAGETSSELAERLAEVLRDLDQGLEGARALENGRVYVGGREGDSVTFEGTELGIHGTPGTSPGTFAIPVIPSASVSAEVVAAQLITAINRAREESATPLLTRVFSSGGGTVVFDLTSDVAPGAGGLSLDVVELSPIRDLAGNQLVPNRPNGETQFTILMPEVQLDFGDAPFQTLFNEGGAYHVLGDIALPRLGRLAGADADGYPSGGDDFYPEVQVTVSQPALAQILPLTDPSKTRVEFGIPSFAPADGDRIQIRLGSRTITFELTSDEGIGAGNQSIEFDPATVTPESLAAALRDKINSSTWPIAVATIDPAQPSRVHLDTDDDDGVAVGPFQSSDTAIPIDGLFLTPDGQFLSFLNPLDEGAEASIFVTGNGLLDAWIDFNQDGDWSDPGEQVLTNASVLDGENRLRIPVPADALDGLTWARFRISPTGNLSSGGVAIGGEVEDYQVRVISIAPPVLVDDAYTTDEDGTLVVSAGDGVLLGSGADTFDQFNEVAAEVEQTPRFGSLQLNSDGSFVYTPDPNFYGTDTFTYRITGTRDLIPGNPNSGTLPYRSGDVATVTLTVNPVNDQPLALDHTFDTLEDLEAGRVITAADLLAGARPGDFASEPDAPYDESAQTLRITSITVGSTILAPTSDTGEESLSAETEQGMAVTANFLDGALVDLHYQPTNNYNFDNPLDPTAAIPSPDVISYTVTDDGRTVFVDGEEITLDEQSTTAAVTFSVAPVNDPPQFDFIGVHEVPEDAGAIEVVAAGNLLPGPVTARDEADQTVTFTLTPDPANPAGLFLVAPTIDSNGVLRYQSAPNQWGTAVFTVVAQDDGPADDSIGDDPEADPVQLTITITPVNDAPQFSPVPEIDVLEDTGPFEIQYATDVLPGPADATDEADQALTFHVVADPANAPGLITGVPTIDADGVLRFTTGADAVGAARFFVTLQDDGGTENPGDEDTSPVTVLTIHVRPVNDEPRVIATEPTRYTLLEDTSRLIPLFSSGPGQPAGLLEQFSVGPDNEADDSPGGNQQLSLVDFGSMRTIHGVVQTVKDSSGNVTALRYTPDAHYNSGPNGEVGDRIFFTVADDGVTFNLTTGMLEPDPRVAQFEVELVIEPVNDEPRFDALTNSVRRLEDSGTVSVPGFATNIQAGPQGAGDEIDPVTGQTVTFQVTPAPGYTAADMATLFTSAPTVSSDGTLRFTTAPDAVGTIVVLVTAVDSGAHDPDRGDDRFSQPATLTITLAPVNDPPVASPQQVSYELDEDRSILLPLTNSQGTGLYDIFAVGPANEGPGNTPGGNQTFAMDATLYPSGTLGGGRIEPEFVGGQLVGLRYTPATDFNGQDSFIYGVRDNGRTFNLNTNSLEDAFREAFATVSLTVNPVNDAPQFAGGVDVTVDEDAGSDDPTVPAGQVGRSAIENWATNILAGPATANDENAGPNRQSVSFEITYASGDDPSEMFTELPTVDPATGQLRFRTAPDANGSVTFQVVAVDNGPSGSLGAGRPVHENRSAPRQFTINVTPVNDAPTFTAGGNVTVTEDSGPYNLLWATDILPGPADEQAAGQAVVFDVEVDQADLARFAVAPTISDEGILRFTPADDAFGDVVVSVTARDTSGAVSPSPVLLTISITPVNDAPVAVDDAISTDEDTVLTLPIGALLGNDVDVDLPEDTLSISEISSTSLLGATIVLSEDGTTFTYDPSAASEIQSLRPGETATDLFTYRIEDEAGLSSGIATVTLTIAGINDAPIAQSDDVGVRGEGPTTFQPLANDIDVDGTLDASNLMVTLQPAFGSITVAAEGSITYTPFESFQGTDLIRYRVRDDLGAVSNQAEIRITVNDMPLALSDSVLTYRNEAITFDPLANDSDPDGSLDASSLQIVSTAAHGQVIVNDDGTIHYLPDEGFSGTDTLTYRVQDNDGEWSNVANVEIRVIGSRLQNPDRSEDVNDSGEVSPIDALLVINFLNRNGGPVDVDPDSQGPPYLDVDGNQRVTPLDALRVINFLNRNPRFPGGEGESATGAAPAPRFARVDESAPSVDVHVATELTDTSNDADDTSFAWHALGGEEDEIADVIDRLVDRDGGDEGEVRALDEVWTQFGGQA